VIFTIDSGWKWDIIAELEEHCVRTYLPPLNGERGGHIYWLYAVQQGLRSDGAA